MTEPFGIHFVPGVTPDKWLRTWRERHPDLPVEATQVEPAAQLGGLRDGSASMCLVRLPVEREGLHVIPLYEEVPVVVVSREHPVAAFDEVDVADLADEPLQQHPDEVPEWGQVAGPRAVARAASLEPMTTAEAVSVVAAGVGIVILPLSVARLHHRKDVVSRPVRGVAGSRVALAWRVDDDDPRIEDFIGIVRGRTARSSRGTVPPATAQTSAPGQTPARTPRPGKRSRTASPSARRGGGRGRRR